MFLQPPIILVVPQFRNLVHFDSGEDDDYDNENYGDDHSTEMTTLPYVDWLPCPTCRRQLVMHTLHTTKRMRSQTKPSGTTREMSALPVHRDTCAQGRMPANYKNFGSFPGCRFTICLKYIHLPFCLSHVCTFSLYGDEGILMCKPHTWAC